MNKPSKQTLKIARRILASSEVRPAVMAKDGTSWTIQWLDLKRLARHVDAIAASPTDGAASDKA